MSGRGYDQSGPSHGAMVMIEISVGMTHDHNIFHIVGKHPGPEKEHGKLCWNTLHSGLPPVGRGYSGIIGQDSQGEVSVKVFD